MRADDRVRLLHMRDAAEAVVEFVQGRHRADLDSDRMLLFAVVRAIEVIGEAAGRVSDEVRADNPSIPWTAIVGMRYRLVHGYFDIDKSVVWRTATEEIPALLAQLNTVLHSRGS